MLLRFYKQSYLLIAAIVFALGVVAAFIAPQLVHDEQFPKAELAVYFMFTYWMLASYLYAHKRAMLTADQRNFLNSFAHMIAQVTACILQVAVLLLFQSMFLYLVVKVAGRLLENLIISRAYQKRYPHISTGAPTGWNRRKKRTCSPISKRCLCIESQASACSPLPALLSCISRTACPRASTATTP